MAVITLSDETIRRRDVRVKMEWPDLKALIRQKALSDLDISDVEGIIFEIGIKQEERGSPSYRVDQWTVFVKVVLPVD